MIAIDAFALAQEAIGGTLFFLIAYFVHGIVFGDFCVPGLVPKDCKSSPLKRVASTKMQVVSGKASNAKEKTGGARPAPVTCSILLQSVQANSSDANLNEAFAMMEKMEKMGEKMDEVLLGSVIEACIRAGRTDLLKSFLSRQRRIEIVEVHSAHVFGSLIRAYGILKDIDEVWATWQKLKAANVELTSVTVGCMVEAVTMNMGPQNGYELIRETLNDDQTKNLVNSIIYGSVLKGFSQSKQFDKVWEIYKEMKREGIAFTIATYNALVDACARSAEVGLLPDILSGMFADNIQPDIITYCAIIKCYCQANQIDRAVEMMKEMRTNFQPDEHTYNTVINGCARLGLYDKGVALLEEMCKSGIKPSNFTLSVLVKLASRSRRLDKAFDLCEDLSQKYNLRLNVHVYDNLIQSCICNQKCLRSAFDVIDRMLSQKIGLDTRTYALLVQGCADAAEAQDLIGLVRAAFGLDGVHSRHADVPRSLLQPQGGLPPQLLSDMMHTIALRSGSVALVKQLLQDLRDSSSCKLDPKLLQRWLVGEG